MGADLAALDNNRMLGAVGGHYKQDLSLSIDALPKALEIHKLSQVFFAKLPIKSPEMGFSASLIVDHLPATLETDILSHTLFVSEEIEMNEDSAPMKSHPSYSLSFTKGFPSKEVNQEIREKHFLFMESHHSKFHEKCITSEKNDLQKEPVLIYPFLNARVENSSCKFPQKPSEAPKTQAKEPSSDEEQARTQPVIMQKERLLTKMQSKEKEENLKQTSSEKTEKQKELTQEGRIVKNIQVIKEKSSEIYFHRENHYKEEKERRDQEGKQGDQQQQNENHNKQKEDTSIKIKKTVTRITYSSFHAQFVEANVSITFCHKKPKESMPLRAYTFTQANVAEYGFPQKYKGIPLLSLPQIGIVCLYYVLTKLNIISEASSQEDLQQQIKVIDFAMTERKKMRLKDMEKAIFAEKSVKDWGIGTRMTSWLASFAALLGGISLIASGSGALVGGILIALGVINITSQVLEITDGWKKIAEKLGDDDPVKTRAIIMWMQIGIAIISFVLMGASAVFGGITPLKDACTSASGFFTAVAGIGVGVVLIGKALAEHKYYNYMAALKKHDFYIEQYKHEKENLMAASAEGLENIQSSFEDLGRALDMYHQDVRRISAAMA